MIFAPMDQQGPDARRKQLMSKLMGQVQQNLATNSNTPLPAMNRGSSALAGAGAPFRGAATVLRSARPQTTQGTNILPSILAKLGAALHDPQQGELSPGHGLAIGDPASVIANLHASPVLSPGPIGHPIPTPTAPQVPGNGAVDPQQAAAAAALGVTPQANMTGDQLNAQLAANGQPTQAYPMQITPNQPTQISGGAGPIPLGNGLFYDPDTQTIIGQQSVDAAGAAVRALAGHPIAA